MALTDFHYMIIALVGINDYLAKIEHPEREKIMFELKDKIINHLGCIEKEGNEDQQ